MDPCPNLLPHKGKPRLKCFFASKTIINLMVPILAFLWVIVLVNTSLAIYPEISVSGYKNWIYNKIDVEPAANYFLYVSSTEGFNRNTGGPWSEALHLNVNLQHNEDLGINYLINQYPAEEDNYRLGLNYKNYSLILGNPNLFINQELMPAEPINGTTIAGEFGKFNLKYLISGDFPKAALKGPFKDQRQYLSPKYFGPKSQTGYGQNDSYLELLGYELGRSDIKGESVQVSVGRKKLIKDFDFFLDTEYGLLLLPSAFKDYQTGIITCESMTGDKIEKSFNLETETSRRAYYIPEFRVIDGSEIIAVDGLKLIRGIDYRVYYNSGLFILNRALPEDAEVQTDYDFCYGANHYAADTISGQTGSNFQLSYINIISGSEKVYKNGTFLTWGYFINYSNGVINFSIPLMATDIVEVKYSYQGIRQTATAFSSEYELADWHKVGISYLEISPNKADEPLFNTYNPSKFTIWGLNDRLDINPSTYILAEYSQSASQPDYRSSLTQEADSALKVSARTEIRGFQLSANYKNVGPDFASVRKVKNGENWKFEEKSVQGEYRFGERLRLYGGVGTEFSKQGVATQEETTNTSLGFDFMVMPEMLMDTTLNVKNRKLGENETSQLYGIRLTPLDRLPALKTYASDLNLILKYNCNETGANWRETMTQGLLQAEFRNGFSAGVGRKESSAFISPGALRGDRTDNQFRIAYGLKFSSEHNLEVYGDYINGHQENILTQTEFQNASADISENGYGFVWKIPQDNPILTDFFFGGYVKTTNYSDRLNSANNYRAITMSTEGRLDF